jgi:hypothetical protein
LPKVKITLELNQQFIQHRSSILAHLLLGLPSMSMGIARKHEDKVKPVSVGGIALYPGEGAARTGARAGVPSRSRFPAEADSLTDGRITTALFT